VETRGWPPQHRLKKTRPLNTWVFLKAELITFTHAHCSSFCSISHASHPSLLGIGPLGWYSHFNTCRWMKIAHSSRRRSADLNIACGSSAPEHSSPTMRHTVMLDTSLRRRITSGWGGAPRRGNRCMSSLHAACVSLLSAKGRLWKKRVRTSRFIRLVKIHVRHGMLLRL
jgi:hypothetical protein